MTILIFILIIITPDIPDKTDFDNPEKVYVFDKEYNDEIRKHVNQILKRKIFGIMIYILTFIIMITTIIKIVIIIRFGKKDNNLENDILNINNQNEIMLK